MKTFLLKLWFNIYKYIHVVNHFNEYLCIFFKNIENLSLEEQVKVSHNFINFINNYFKEMYNVTLESVING